LALNIIGPLTGFGGQSTEDVTLEAVNDGFRVLNERLTDIQEQILQGFLEVSQLVGDIALDELSADLDSITRQFSNYIDADNATRPIYEATFRSFCNEPFHTPQDIFYNLYGYVCKSCAFAPRKLADIRAIYAKLNPISQANFRRDFGNFMIRSMLNAQILHELCLPPIDGSCVDRSTDAVWKRDSDQMVAALNETVDVIAETALELSDWVNLLTLEQLNGFFPDGVDNQVAADAVFNFLNETQPDFHIQVLVSDAGSDFNPINVWRVGCEKSPETPCSTNRLDTGHFWFKDGITSKEVSIRYRL
jgi:hypothetical protein